jgi:UDP-4-amino-4-deoxy-L-arabinose formyltransferase/UDP-glucuronic acid dehydrogenase (UDP-4-keto-hexauronic acid decarboxylating)
VIWAYGFQHGLRFTLFRPFNWIGPKLDDLALEPEKEGSSRVVTQFISNLIHGEAIRLVDGGEQKRCFTYVDDGIDGLMKIIENRDDACNGEIFNLGNPRNEATIRELAHKLRDIYVGWSANGQERKAAEIIEVSSGDFYGKGYQDIDRRVPSIDKARRILRWEPKVDLDTALARTIAYYLESKTSV